MDCNTKELILQAFTFSQKRVQLQMGSLLIVKISKHSFLDDQPRYFILAVDQLKSISGFLREGDAWRCQLTKPGDFVLSCKNNPRVRYVELKVKAAKQDMSLKNFQKKNNPNYYTNRKKKKDFCAFTIKRVEDVQETHLQYTLTRDLSTANIQRRPQLGPSIETTQSVSKVSIEKTGNQSWIFDGLSFQNTSHRHQASKLQQKKTALTDSESTDMNRSVYSQKGRQKKKHKKQHRQKQRVVGEPRGLNCFLQEWRGPSYQFYQQGQVERLAEWLQQRMKVASQIY